MVARTVKFSDLLTRPAEFAPLEAPESPETPLETISDTSEDDSDDEVSGTTTAAASALSAALPVSSEPTALKPVPSIPSLQPTSQPISFAPGVLMSAPVVTAAPLMTPSLDVTTPPTSSLSVTPDSMQSVPSMTSSLVSTVVEAPNALPPTQTNVAVSALQDTTSSSITVIPALPDTDAPAFGSPFNLTGMNVVFPTVPTDLPGFKVLPINDVALAAAALAGGSQKLNLPGVTTLKDGSKLIAIPSQAMNLAKVSQPCFASLAGDAHLRALQSALKAASRIVKHPEAEDGYAQLMQAVSSLQASDIGSCDATLTATLGSVLQLLTKRRSLATAQDAVETTYKHHASEFRAMKQDMQALSSVLRIDAQAVDDAKRKRLASQAKLDPPLQDQVRTLGRYLQQLDVIASQLR